MRKQILCGLVALQLAAALTVNGRQTSSVAVKNAAGSLATCAEKLISYADWPKVKEPSFSPDT